MSPRQGVRSSSRPPRDLRARPEHPRLRGPRWAPACREPGVGRRAEPVSWGTLQNQTPARRWLLRKSDPQRSLGVTTARISWVIAPDSCSCGRSWRATSCTRGVFSARAARWCAPAVSRVSSAGLPRARSALPARAPPGSDPADRSPAGAPRPRGCARPPAARRRPPTDTAAPRGFLQGELDVSSEDVHQGPRIGRKSSSGPPLAGRPEGPCPPLVPTDQP